MRKNVFTLLICLFFMSIGKAFPQGDGNTTINKLSIEYNIKEIDQHEQRLYVLYHLYTNPEIDLSLGEDDGVFYIRQSECSDNKTSDIFNYFHNYYEKIINDYEKISKDSAAYLYHEYKKQIPSMYINHLMMDYYVKDGINNFCSTALPFCTDNGSYIFPAGVDAGTGESGPDYDCLGSTPNPAWYYMKIQDSGDINIYMYSDPLVDIDFCCWGPFSDPLSPCPYGLTGDKVVSCSYSPDPTETCQIPASAQTGEYYILLITNYSNQTCNINFEKESGTGTTDCTILPPSIISNSPLCVGDTLFLSAQDVFNATYAWIGPDGWTSNLREPYRPNVTLEMQGEYSCSISVEDQTSEPMTTEVSIGIPYDTLLIDTICQGDSYIQNGFVLNSMPAGNYLDTLFLNTIHGCDSIIKLNLTVNPTYDTLIIDTIYMGESYIENNFAFDSMPIGNYFDTLFFNTILGCDSIVKLSLTVGMDYDTIIFDTICQGDNYTENNFFILNAGIGSHYDSLFFNTIYGFDSIVKLNLFVEPSFDTLIIDTICYGDNYLENNFNILTPPSGLYQDSIFLNTIHGCDSIVRLSLTVNPSYDIEINEYICQDEDYIQNGFQFENMPTGNYFDTLFLNTINGCDSIVRLNLIVNPTYDIEINDVACQGDDYLENGFAIESLQVGTYSETLFLNSIHGCDSVVKLNLTVNESFHFEIYDSICYGEDYTLYGLNIIKPNVGLNEYTNNLQTILGCDSIFNVTLKVLELYDEIEIVGEELLLVSTNLTTGCYLYTVGENEEDRTYSWKIDNEDWKIAPNNNECLIWATTPEECTLTVTGGNSCGIVTDFIELTADFFDEVNNSKVMMYPNPAKNHLNIKHNDIQRINVYDSYGQLILRNDYNLDNQVMLDLNSLTSSIYIIEIITPEQTFIERISIIK